MRRAQTGSVPGPAAGCDARKNSAIRILRSTTAEIEAKSTAVSGLVVLALVHELRASLIVAKDLIAQIQARDNRAYAFVDPVAGLGIHLEVDVGPDVAVGTLGAKAGGVGAG